MVEVDFKRSHEWREFGAVQAKVNQRMEAIGQICLLVNPCGHATTVLTPRVYS